MMSLMAKIFVGLDNRFVLTDLSSFKVYGDYIRDVEEWAEDEEYTLHSETPLDEGFYELYFQFVPRPFFDPLVDLSDTQLELVDFKKIEELDTRAAPLAEKEKANFEELITDEED